MSQYCDSATVAREVVTQARAVLDHVAERHGVPAFLASGSLLGAAQNGRLASYSSGVDLAYVSRYNVPVDVTRELFRVARCLRTAGYDVEVRSGAQVRIDVTLPDETTRPVQLAAYHRRDGWLFGPPSLAVHSLDLLPLDEIELEGARFPAPSDVERFVEAEFGAGWRSPDAMFRQAPSPRARRLLTGWFGAVQRHRVHWDRLYDGAYGVEPPTAPSAFARWVAPQLPRAATVVDVGAGNGRDLVHFAQVGHPVIGLDYSAAAIRSCADLLKYSGLAGTVQRCNLYDLRDVVAVGAGLSRRARPLAVYARLLLHAVDGQGRQNFWRLAAMALRGGGRLYLEFEPDPAHAGHVFDDHARWRVDIEEVEAAVTAHGGQVVHTERSTGLAPYKFEDPTICRLVAEW